MIVKDEDLISQPQPDPDTPRQIPKSPNPTKISISSDCEFLKNRVKIPITNKY